jgi:hypothetical protein
MIKAGIGQILPKKRPVVLSDESFEILYEQVDKEMIGERKTTIIESIGKDGLIYASQLAELIDTYSFD